MLPEQEIEELIQFYLVQSTKEIKSNNNQEKVLGQK